MITMGFSFTGIYFGCEQKTTNDGVKYYVAFAVGVDAYKFKVPEAIYMDCTAHALGDVATLSPVGMTSFQGRIYFSAESLMWVNH